MIVSIQSHSAGTCVWCRHKTDDGVHAQFKDGLAGFFCKKDFWSALKARTSEEPTRDEGKTTGTRSPQTS